VGHFIFPPLLTATVGEGGANIPADVATVQYLLNCVPVSQGGHLRELKIDGFAGVVTIEAINRFQKVNFGSSNSRIESSEQTLGELEKYDPLLFSAPVVAPNFILSKASMDPSKMNRSIDGGGIKKSVEGGGIKRRIISKVFAFPRFERINKNVRVSGINAFLINDFLTVGRPIEISAEKR
jgi:hypothetical protein